MRGTVFSRLRLSARKLLCDQRGNALMLTAAAIFPVIGIVGSSIDIGRAYMAQLRLQQACDAAVLAGRRYKGASDYGDEAKAEANKMFAFNYPTGLYGSEALDFSSSWVPTGSEVVGVASARVPTTIMYMFGFSEFNLSSDCGAKLEIANVDVMLVLDVTTSMTWVPERDNDVPSDPTKSRLGGLKSGATIFLDTLLDTSSDEGKLRVGIVPYSGTVNIGRILKQKNASWISDVVTIPSREWDKSKSQYILKNRDYPVAGIAVGGQTSGFLNIDKPTKSNANPTVSTTWNGCVMERATAFISPSQTTIPADAFDMNITMEPDGRDETKWKLYLPRLAWSRSGVSESSTTNDNNSIGENSGNLAVCSTSEAMNLLVMKQGNTKDTGNIALYTAAIKNLDPVGYTYHDAGMAWGARLISPNGLFRDENRRSDGQVVGRHIILMTDGDMNTPRSYYSHQGQEQSIPRIGASSNGDAINRHNNRFKLLCDAAKAEGITVWVIAFSKSVNDYGPLDHCASSGAASRAPTSADLEKTFKQIAGQISKLRLSK